MRIDQLSVAWLADALQCSPHDITGLRSEPIGTGQVADCHRLEFTRAGNPETLVLKLTPESEVSRSSATAFANYRREVGFYQVLAPGLKLRTPRCFFSTVNEAGTEFALLLEDASPCRPGNQLSGCTVDEVAMVLDEAAKLHAPAWLDESLLHLEWLPSAVDQPRPPSSAAPQMFLDFQKQYAGRLSEEVVEVGTQFYDTMAHYCDVQRTMKWSLAHGDFRPDNILFKDDGTAPSAIVVDWQTAQRGPALLDIAYFVGGALTPVDRAAHERDLLQRYHDRLIEHGVEDYPFDECWNDYSIFALQNMLVGVNASLFVQRTDRGDELFLSMTHNAARHALDVDALGRLAALKA